ncbi:MAG: [Clostridia bacterium]|nr:[citrate (pro-3S)-lyase] ligase [Clostridia bacterium]
MNIELTQKLQGAKLNKWKIFLNNAHLSPDLRTDSTALVWENDEIIACGSRSGNLLKCIAVDENHRGEDLTASVLTTLRQDAFQNGYSHLFLYTKPENKFLFSSLFFYPIAQTDSVLLMENKKGGIDDFLAELPVEEGGGKVGCIVMNCNPFTLGHRHLAETASKECDRVYIFVLSEEQSRFSAKDRMEMVKRGTADLNNVTVFPTGPYMISSATFPTYFLKESADPSDVQCKLDIEVFTKYFVPKFSITHRYVGSEPLCPVTNSYNKLLFENLPKHNVSLIEICRKEQEGSPISASLVRKLIDEGHIEDAKKFLPKTTFEYMKENNLIGVKL